MQREERRVGLDGELIKRQMLGGFRDRSLEFGRPGLRRLSGTGVDQIEGIAIEYRARDADGFQRFVGGMQATQFLQRPVIERLYAERHAIDAGGTKAAEAFCLDAGGIGFERDFDIVRNGPVFRDAVEDRRDGLAAASATACRRRKRWW